MAFTFASSTGNPHEGSKPGWTQAWDHGSFQGWVARKARAVVLPAPACALPAGTQLCPPFQLRCLSTVSFAAKTGQKLRSTEHSCIHECRKPKAPKENKEIQQERARTSAEAAKGRHSPVRTKAAPQVATAPSRSRAAAGGLCLLYWSEVGLKAEGGVKRWARRTSALLVSKI